MVLLMSFEEIGCGIVGKVNPFPCGLERFEGFILRQVEMLE